MHKNMPVLSLELDDETDSIIKINHVFTTDHIPIGVGVIKNVPNRGDLNDWWHGRCIPASRQNITEALRVLRIPSTNKLIKRCFGLSLSDHYWINPIKNPLDWNKINFFDHPFSEDVGNVLFGTKPDGKPNLISPNNTSDGWLKKKWQIIDGKRYLIKGGSDPYQQQPLNEVIASIIMRRLNIPHVNYTLIWEGDTPYSVCQNFITRDTELVSAYYIHNTQRITDASDLYHHYIKCCEALGIPRIRQSLDHMDCQHFIEQKK